MDENITDLYTLVTNHFNGNTEKTDLWFKTKNPLLGLMSPEEMIEVGRLEKLKQFVITAIEENSL